MNWILLNLWSIQDLTYLDTWLCVSWLIIVRRQYIRRKIRKWEKYQTFFLRNAYKSIKQLIMNSEHSTSKSVGPQNQPENVMVRQSILLQSFSSLQAESRISKDISRIQSQDQGKVDTFQIQHEDSVQLIKISMNRIVQGKHQKCVSQEQRGSNERIRHVLRQEQLKEKLFAEGMEAFKNLQKIQKYFKNGQALGNEELLQKMLQVQKRAKNILKGYSGS